MPHPNQYLLLYVLDLLSGFARKSDRNLVTAHSNLFSLFHPPLFTHDLLVLDLAVLFRRGLISHPTHELQPSEHQLSQEVLEFLMDQDFFMFILGTLSPHPPTPSRSLTPPLTARVQA